MAPKNVADRVNLGLIPTSSLSWQTACEALNQERGGFLHIHENVDTGAKPTQGVDSVAGSRCISNESNDSISGSDIIEDTYNFENNYGTNKIDNVGDGTPLCISNQNIGENVCSNGTNLACNIQNNNHGTNNDTTLKDINHGDTTANQYNAIGDQSWCRSTIESEKNEGVILNTLDGSHQCQCSNTVVHGDSGCVISQVYGGKKLSENKRIVWCHFVKMMIGKLKSYFSLQTTTSSTTILHTLSLSSPTAEWSVCLRHIELVKSYAPHVDHVVFDVECRPIR